jgi:hypothetical protein
MRRLRRSGDQVRAVRPVRSGISAIVHAAAITAASPIALLRLRLRPSPLRLFPFLESPHKAIVAVNPEVRAGRHPAHLVRDIVREELDLSAILAGYGEPRAVIRPTTGR